MRNRHSSNHPPSCLFDLHDSYESTIQQQKRFSPFNKIQLVCPTVRDLPPTACLKQTGANGHDGSLTTLRIGLKGPVHLHTSLGRYLMMVRVVISNATRVPCTSLDLSTLVRQPTTYLGPLLALTMSATGHHGGATVLKASRKANAGATRGHSSRAWARTGR